MWHNYLVVAEHVILAPAARKGVPLVEVLQDARVNGEERLCGGDGGSGHHQEQDHRTQHLTIKLNLYWVEFMINIIIM